MRVCLVRPIAVSARWECSILMNAAELPQWLAQRAAPAERVGNPGPRHSRLLARLTIRCMCRFRLCQSGVAQSRSGASGPYQPPITTLTTLGSLPSIRHSDVLRASRSSPDMTAPHGVSRSRITTIRHSDELACGAGLLTRRVDWARCRPTVSASTIRHAADGHCRG